MNYRKIVAGAEKRGDLLRQERNQMEDLRRGTDDICCSEVRQPHDQRGQFLGKRGEDSTVVQPQGRRRGSVAENSLLYVLYVCILAGSLLSLSTQCSEIWHRKDPPSAPSIFKAPSSSSSSGVVWCGQALLWRERGFFFQGAGNLWFTKGKQLLPFSDLHICALE